MMSAVRSPLSQRRATPWRSRRTVLLRPAARHDDRTDAALVERVSPALRLMHRYCRLDVVGLQNVPTGRALIVPNHTGWLGLDYANLGSTLYEGTGRVSNVVVHPAWFRIPQIAKIATRLGFIQPRTEEIVGRLSADRLVTVFPEGTSGAFKPVGRAAPYELAEFRRGFVRAAMATQSPIVPVAIVGGEEANPCLGALPLTERWLAFPVPIPLNLVPLPVKWTIRFLPPVRMDEYSERDAADTERVHALASDVRNRVQETLNQELGRR